MANLFLGIFMLLLTASFHTMMPFGMILVMLLVGGVNAILGMLDVIMDGDN